MAAGIVPAVKTSDPLVEAQVVESPHGRLLVLSNWACEPRTVTVCGKTLPPVEVGYGSFVPLH